MKRIIPAALLALTSTVSACADETPTAPNDALIPGSAESVEVLLPLDEETADVRILGGFGTPWELNRGYVALDFDETLDARTLARFGSFPASIQVEDEEGTTLTDTTFTFVGGRIVARFDTVGVADDPLELRVGALTQSWHPRTANWQLAVDTAGREVDWEEAGAGPATVLDSATWDPAETDSVVFEVDSATVAEWRDDENEARGMRLELLDPGVRLEVQDLQLRAEVRPSVIPDTTVFRATGSRDLTFIYTPSPADDPGVLRIGGAPAWRTVFEVDLPETLDGPPELCAALGCPFEVLPEVLNYASLVLTSRPTPPAFRTADTLTMELRGVLRPELLPKSPLGNSLAPSFDGRLGPEVFGAEAEERVEIPLTGHARQLARPDTGSAADTPRTVVLLSPSEPASFSYGEFFGPGSASPPTLRLIVTQADQVTLP